MNMRYVTAWVAALVCAGLGSSSLIASIAQGGTVEVAVTIDFQVRQLPLSETLVGVSLSADNQGNGVAAQGVEAAAIASTAQIRAEMLRFPDDISQSYHWQSAAAEGDLTTFEFWSLANEAKVPNLMATVNMISGAPDEAAKWVAMANQPAGTPNASTYRSSATPYNIAYWLLGEDISNHPEKYLTPEAYGVAALENATRMRAAFPTIRIGLWIEDGTTDAGAAYNNALLLWIKNHEPYQNGTSSTRLIDFLAVAVDVLVPNRPLTDAALFPSLYAYAASRAEKVVAAAETASTTNLSFELPIAVYRYGIDFGADGWNHDKADSLGVANALSGMVNVFAHHEKLFTAVYIGLNSDGFNALLQVPTAYEVARGQRFALNPFGGVLATYGQFLTGKTVSSELQGAGQNTIKAYYQAPAVGRTIPSSDRVPILSTHVAYDPTAEQMVIFASSRSLTDRIVAHVTLTHLPTGVVDPQISAHAFQSASLSTDGYTGITHLEGHTDLPTLAIATAPNGDLSFDLTLERNAVSLFVFTLVAS